MLKLEHNPLLCHSTSFAASPPHHTTLHTHCNHPPLSPLPPHTPQVAEECSDAILKVEHEFAKKKRPMYSERNSTLRNVPGFWKQVSGRGEERGCVSV